MAGGDGDSGDEAGSRPRRGEDSGTAAAILSEEEEEEEDESRTPPDPEHGGGGGSSSSSSSKLVRLPVSRIRQIIKADPDVSLASQEAVVVLAKATELFVQHLSKEATQYTFQGRRKTIKRKDLDEAVENEDSFAFLEGALD